MKTMKMTLTVLCTLIMTVTAWSQESTIKAQLQQHPDDPDLLLRAGEYYLQAAGRGDAGAAGKSESYLSKLLGLEPRNGRAMACYGSLLTIKARDAGRQQEQIKYMQRGLAKLDKAVILCPDDPFIRMTRGSTYSNIPAFFNRLDTAVKDFEHVVTLQKKSDMHLPLDFWAPFHLAYGYALVKKNDPEGAALQYKTLITKAPEHPLAEQAKELLDQLELE